MLDRISKLNDRGFKPTTGLHRSDFFQMTNVFSQCEQTLQEQHYQGFQAHYGRKPSATGKPLLKTASEKLFFLLFYLKVYPSFDVLGFTFGCSGKTAHTNVHKYLPVLEKTLAQLIVLPKRGFTDPDAFIDFVRG